MQRSDLIVLSVVGVLGWASAVVGQQQGRAQRDRAVCANNLRQVALASIIYADDRRFFPHVGPLRELDGGLDTNHTTKVARALLYYQYLDNPEAYICPASDDQAVDLDPNRARQDWCWEGDYEGDPDASPFRSGNDPVARDTHALSYGYTRKGMNANVRSTTPLAADRAARKDPEATDLPGNHSGGWNVAFVDGSVTWHAVTDQPFPGDWLTATDGPRPGFLGLEPQLDPDALARD